MVARKTADTYDDPKTVSRWLDLARGILEQPTAAYKEECPRAFIRAFAKARPALKLTEDPSGNLLVTYGPRSARAEPIVMVAHLDHPGFWIEAVSDGVATLSFKGGVGAGHAHNGLRVRFYELGERQSVGAGEIIGTTEAEGRLEGATARIVEGMASVGGYAMWDFPGFSVEDETIVTRCCDDLLGAAAALSALDEIARRKPRGVTLWGLFTRAEEVGFLGTLEAIRYKTLPKKALVLSLECSKAAGIAPQGEGVIVRVGDKSSIFDPGLTQALRMAAEEVRKRLPGFKYQRKLMDGGSCEATAFCAYGYRSSGLAVPLGNYHNQAFEGEKKTIGPENVRIDDYLNEVRLLVELAQHPELLDVGCRKPDWLLERARVAKKELPLKQPPKKTAKRKTWVD